MADYDRRGGGGGGGGGGHRGHGGPFIRKKRYRGEFALGFASVHSVNWVEAREPLGEKASTGPKANRCEEEHVADKIGVVAL